MLIYESPELKIWQLPSGPFETNCYLLASEKLAYVIDPAPDSAPRVLQIVEKEKLQLQGILLTHSHWDHISDVAALLKLYPQLFVAVHEADRFNLQTPGADGLPLMAYIEGVTPTKLLKDKDVLQLGNSSWEVIHTPGHSTGSICFYNVKEGLLFSGDTLFQETYGNISFPTSEPKKMKSSLRKLSQLPADTKVFPGHGQDTTIGTEKWLGTV